MKMHSGFTICNFFRIGDHPVKIQFMKNISIVNGKTEFINKS